MNNQEKIEEFQLEEDFEAERARLKKITDKIYETIITSEKSSLAKGMSKQSAAVMRDAALSKLRREFAEDKVLKEYHAEVNALIDAARLPYLSAMIVKYKERQLMPNPPDLTEPFLRKQNELREDITQTIATLRWYILQNESETDYLYEFLSALEDLWYKLNQEKIGKTLEKGLFQELGAYRILKNYFQEVKPSSPEEDAHFGFDFWVQTKSGKNLLIQSKSSSAFGRAGIFSENEVRELAKKLEGEAVDKLFKNSGKWLPDWVRMKRTAKSFEEVKDYVKNKKNIDVEVYLMVIPEEFIQKPLGYPSQEALDFFKKDLERLANN